MQNKKKLIAALCALVLLVAVAVGAYFLTRPPVVEGDKTISVAVLYDDKTETFTISTDETYLRGALEGYLVDGKPLIAGDESEYGLYVQTVCGKTADAAASEFWGFYQSGEMLNTGVDTTPIADGDSFEIKLEVWSMDWSDSDGDGTDE